jgi:hypothetical protein
LLSLSSYNLLLLFSLQVSYHKFITVFLIQFVDVVVVADSPHPHEEALGSDTGTIDLHKVECIRVHKLFQLNHDFRVEGSWVYLAQLLGNVLAP